MPEEIHQPEPLGYTIPFGIRGTPRPYKFIPKLRDCKYSSQSYIVYGIESIHPTVLYGIVVIYPTIIRGGDYLSEVICDRAGLAGWGILIDRKLRTLCCFDATLAC